MFDVYLRRLQMFDIAIIGAGIIGCSIARELSKYNYKTIILDKENDISCGTTKANSAIIHAGYDASYTSKKGIFNARGNMLYDQVTKELDVPFKRIGSLVVAFADEEIETLKDLLDNGNKLEIPGLEIIGPEKIYEMEPNLAEGAVAALYAPSAGIIEPWEMAIAYAENAIENGVELKLNYEVKSINELEDRFEIQSTDGELVDAKIVINAAGVYGDNIYKLVKEDFDFDIHPRRGQYFLLDKSADGLVNSVIFKCPSKLGKGVLVVPTVDGNVLVGPDSEDLDNDQKEAIETTADRLSFVRENAVKLVKNIPFRENITTFSGLRAEPSNGDFIIEESEVKNFINVIGIKSPGLSSAPAIAEYIEKMVVDKLGDSEVKEDYNPTRRPRIKFMELSEEEKEEMITKDPRYGRIICRCEMITEGEIVDAIHRSAGGRTINGIKRRVRPGAGRCQGGFCGPRVLEILARELEISPLDVKHEGKDSTILVGNTKN
jgi:glycerol-3-phosphate dehydrogenase